MAALELGYARSSEEHEPRELVCNAVLAERVGMSFAFISAHYQPWTDEQGQVGHDQQGFFRFFERELRPQLRDAPAA